MLAANPAGCVQKPPPLYPALFPLFSEPGFWCWALTGPTGITASECVKHQEQCEYDLASTMRKLKLSVGSVKCARATAKPICFAWKIDDKAAFVCTIDKQACEAGRAVALASDAPTGHTRTAPTECTEYPYD